MIEFNRGHYSRLKDKQEYYNKVLGNRADPYDNFVNMIGLVISPYLTTQFPCSISIRQELIKIIMIAQADAVRNNLDVTSLEPSFTVAPQNKLFNFLRKKNVNVKAN